MWKVVLLLLAVFILGHLAVRYVLKNPLDPEIEGNEVVVQSQEYEVRFARNGPFSGTYLVAGANSDDWSNRPVNARLEVVGFKEAADYLRAYPDFHLYGAQSGTQITSLASPLALVAANRETYSDLRGLVDLHESRSAGHGERLCVTVSGEALSLDAAHGLDDQRDHTETVAHTLDGSIVFASSLAVDDCVKLLAPNPH